MPKVVRSQSENGSSSEGHAPSQSHRQYCVGHAPAMPVLHCREHHPSSMLSTTSMHFTLDWSSALATFSQAVTCQRARSE